MDKSKIEWQPPKILNPHSFRDEYPEFRDIEVNEDVDVLAKDIAELLHPDKTSSKPFMSLARMSIAMSIDNLTNIVVFEHDNTAVRYPKEELHHELRTDRRRNLDTTEELKVLGEATIASIGLSVGSNIAEAVVQDGIGKEIIIADYDTISATNLNRINATMADVGLRKTVWFGRRISAINPYMKQTHLSEGYSPSCDNELSSKGIDVIIEEVDNMQAKAQTRELAKNLKVPLVMVGDLGDTVLLDVERHDLENVKPFNGKVSLSLYEKALAGELSKKETETFLLKINQGLKNVSPRMIQSAMLRGVELNGFPQKGGTVKAGASLASLAIGEILLGRKVSSGSYRLPLRKVLKLSPATTFRESLAIFGEFIKYRKNDS